MQDWYAVNKQQLCACVLLVGCLSEVNQVTEDRSSSSVNDVAQPDQVGASIGTATENADNSTDFPAEQWKALETYYVSPDGSNEGDGTAEDPWQSFSHAVAQLKAGSHLILKDGVYTQSLDVSVSGSQDHPIVIRAEHDGGAVIDGQGIRHTLRMRGTATDPLHDVVFWGFSAANSNRHVFHLSHVQRVIFKRITGHDAVQVDKNHHVFECASECSDVLVEDCAAWGTGRILFSYYGSTRGTFRRVYARYGGSNYGNVRTAIALYGSSYSVVENCVVTQDATVQDSVEGIKINRRDGNANADGNRVVGNVVYGLSSGQGRAYFVQGNESIKDGHFSNNVSIGNAVGIYQRNDESLWVERSTVVSSSEKGFLQSGYPNAQSCDWKLGGHIQTSLIIDAPIGISRSTKALDLPADCSTTAYGELTAAQNYIDGSTALQNVEHTEPCNDKPMLDTDTYGLGAYLIPHRCAGQAIGAEVIYRLHNTVPTEQPLWPWPMEERIFKEVAQSVTHASGGGLWKQLPMIQ